MQPVRYKLYFRILLASTNCVLKAGISHTVCWLHKTPRKWTQRSRVFGRSPQFPLTVPSMYWTRSWVILPSWTWWIDKRTYNVTLWPARVTRNKTFHFYCCWRTCNWQQYTSVQCYHGNATLGPLCTVVELQNTSCCCQNNKYQILWTCVYILALVHRHEKRMRRIILSSVACLAMPYFSTFSHKRDDFHKKKCIEHNMCILTFSTNFVWNTSHYNNSAKYLVLS